MTVSDKVASLDEALRGVTSIQIQFENFQDGETVSDWVQRQGLKGFDLGGRRVVGFSSTGFSAVRRFVKLLRSHDAKLQNWITELSLLNQVLPKVRQIWIQDNTIRANYEMLNSFEQGLHSWLNSFAGERTHFIPCKIQSDPLAEFSVGPVKFIHIKNLDGSKYSDDWKTDGDPFLRFAQEQQADWIGIVQVLNREPSRSSEIADTAVDISLGAIQVALPDICAENIARVTARSIPSNRRSLVLTQNGRFSWGWRDQQPGLGVGGNVFDYSIRSEAALLQSMGRRVEAFLTETSHFPALEQAWCDAVFWFHEGLSEPLDTVAIAKLEICLESLVAAANTSGSKKRLMDACNVLLGFSANAMLEPELSLTLEQLIISLITSRSRVLHGTWSTLGQDDLNIEREHAAKLARSLLSSYPVYLDSYIAAQESEGDTFEGLLRWIHRRRSRRKK